MPPLTRISFHVSGKVQGVFFRKYTKAKADELGLRGWVENSSDGTSVVGAAEGPNAAIDRFTAWLRLTGSPKSRVDAVTVTGREEGIEAPSFASFEIRRGGAVA